MAMNNEKEMLVQAANSMPDYAEQIAEMVKGDLSPKTIQERLDSYHDGDIANAVQLLEPTGRTRRWSRTSWRTCSNTSNRSVRRNIWSRRTSQRLSS